jgi:hypothetical protein
MNIAVVQIGNVWREDRASGIGEEGNRQPERRKKERKRSRKRKTNPGDEEANRRHFGRDGAFCASIVIRLRQPTHMKYYVRAPEDRLHRKSSSSPF